MKSKPKRLGKGLEALIPQVSEEEKAVRGDALDSIPVSQIRSNPLQPRLAFDRRKLDELKQSITENGLIQPITVRRMDDGYELVSGERRLRSVLELGIDRIPAYVIDVESDERLLELALIENIQRDDLNAIEVAAAYERLQKEYSLTQEDVARKVGKDRATVANFIRLLKLPDVIQDSLKKNEISMGHARALMGLASRGEQIQLWRRIVKDGWSVRRIEEAVRDATEKPARKTEPPAPSKDPVLLSMEDRLRTVLGSRVQIRPSGTGGKIEIAYFSKDDLDRLFELIEQIQS
jgi:ParB family chromosome partitioning protein